MGLVVAAAAATFGFGLYLIGHLKLGSNRSYRVYAIFDDATGLGVRSRVQIAGIPVGQVEKIELDQQLARAKVFIRVDGQYLLHRDASIAKRSESILGDFLLDLAPGSPQEPLLQDGDQITIVVRQPGMNEVFKSLSKIADDISDITGNLRKALGGEKGEASLKNIVGNLDRITANLERVIESSGPKLDATLANFQRFSNDLARITGSEREDAIEIIRNTKEATAEARQLLHAINDQLGTGANANNPNAPAKGLKASLDKLDLTLANLRDITDKVNKGEGTVGHLINDDKLAKNLDKASTQITNLLGEPDTLKIEVNERSELLLGVPGGGGRFDPTIPNVAGALRDTAYNPWAKNYFGIRIIPRPDKWYGAEIVDDPRGLTKQVRTVNNPGCGTLNCNPYYPDALETTTTERTLKFSVYIAKRYGHVSGRFGILENTGGFGLKLHTLNDALTFNVDAFEFANPLKDRPRVKFWADYRFLDHLLVTVGADDIANKPYVDPEHTSRIISGRDFFIGAGAYFTDDDISKLLGLAVSAGRF